jgi:hypothetical protein
VLDLNDIYVVTRWDGKEEVKVPSEFSYSRTPNLKKQYGYDIDDKSDVLARTKLELEDHDDRLKELRTFADTLHGLTSLSLNDATAITHQIPKHLSKNSEDIIENYLYKVAEVVYADMVSTLGRHVPEQIPIDLIITHPAVSLATNPNESATTG